MSTSEAPQNALDPSAARSRRPGQKMEGDEDTQRVSHIPQGFPLSMFALGTQNREAAKPDDFLRLP